MGAAILSRQASSSAKGLDAMVQSWLRLRLYASPDRSAPGSSRESAHGRGPSIEKPCSGRAEYSLWPDFSPRRLSMGDSRQEGYPLTGSGHDLSPPLGVVETMGVAPEGAQLIASGLSTEVAETILQSRAPSIRKLYALKLRLRVRRPPAWSS